MRVSTREAIIGLVVYRLAKYVLRRKLTKGGGMATAKKVGIIAAIGAAIGALFFWRKKKKQEPEQGEAL
jgi:hypothetical protein